MLLLSTFIVVRTCVYIYLVPIVRQRGYRLCLGRHAASTLGTRAPLACGSQRRCAAGGFRFEGGGVGLPVVEKRQPVLLDWRLSCGVNGWLFARGREVRHPG